MTNAKKIEILKKMRELIESGYTDFLCSAYIAVTSDSFDEEYKIQTILGIEKPKVTFSRLCWYDSDNDGRDARIRKIDEAIKRLEK